MSETKPYDVALREMRKKSPDSKKALKLLQIALKKGDARAAYALGTWHLFGAHVERNTRRAIELLSQAADANIPEALYDLGVCYEDGAGVRKSERKAYELYLRAAVWGDHQSVYEVGRCLFYGIGVQRNRTTARIWLSRAKSLGFPRQSRTRSAG